MKGVGWFPVVEELLHHDDWLVAGGGLGGRAWAASPSGGIGCNHFPSCVTSFKIQILVRENLIGSF